MSSPDRALAPPRRRQRLDEAQRRKQIIAGCIQVLAEHGYQQASLALIAEVAGVSKGLIWHYYSDRDTLMEQVAVTTVAQLRHQVGADIDLTAPVPDVLDAAIHRAADLGRTHPTQLRALSQIAQNLRAADGTLRLDLTYYEETYQAQEELFHRGQAEGSLRDFDTRVMAVTYQGAIDAMLGYLESHTDTDIGRYADTLSNLVIQAVKAHRPDRPSTTA
ncbi:TetR/AcrR family transcriptional regulator [Lapillicoccus sp.]|uniref:TetR/AcrR family transcriptional regulator n=1 Tax=Lapillicoccus sp. TaxID=1909287 RepID=UPI0027C0067F|nr:TetR/AcrR family transcriptional regulator [Actinomycetota bacterium]